VNNVVWAFGGYFLGSTLGITFVFWSGKLVPLPTWLELICLSLFLEKLVPKTTPTSKSLFFPGNLFLPGELARGLGTSAVVLVP